MSSTVALIAARGGSKGLPHKNILPFCGKPLIVWSIEVALNCPEISAVFVTSDCDEILQVSVDAGAIAIKRPAELSEDQCTSESAWLHSLQYIEEKYDDVEYICAMQATSPLREVSDLTTAIKKIKDKSLDSIFSAGEIKDFLIWEKNDSGLHSMNYDYKKRLRRQDIESQYVENGSFYIFKPKILIEDNNRIGGQFGVSLMDFWKSFEIDDDGDFEFCQVLMKNYILSNLGEYKNV